MRIEYRQAFTEVYEIIEMTPDELREKIPKKFYDMIKENMDKDYFPNIKEPLEKQELKDETIAILGLIYRDFLCSKEERNKLKEKDAYELKMAEEEIEKVLIPKYNPDDIFKKKNQDKKVSVEEKKEMIIIEKEKWYKKLLNIIKHLFNK